MRIRLLCVQHYALLASLATIAGCGNCPPGVRQNVENVKIITADNEALLATSTRSEAEKTDIRLHNAKAKELAEAMDAACGGAR